MFLDLCYDVLIRILEEINPDDLAACAQTSWGFNTFIKENIRLHKAHYLRNFVCSECSIQYLCFTVLIESRTIHVPTHQTRNHTGYSSCRN
jgi:hypothetical protein